jgi:RHS repeat-associated protein
VYDRGPTGVRLPGQYYDAESGLHYNYFRDYDPATGRYVQSDPIGLAGGINTYLYAGGNPVLYIDPLGLDNGACVNFGSWGIAGV